MRVEEDFGGGFVRLKSTEADKRQAAQDIRSSEDIVLELLRNARDAGAKNIFVSMHREGDRRCLVVLDDGDGIPQAMTERIFQPRVTSKLDSAHLDKWGIHGRGMALFSIRANADSAEVRRSAPGRGSSIKVVTDTAALPEKADQSTFPYFEEAEGTYVMRGPKNLLRTAAEFAFDCRKELQVYCGSPTEIAATLYSRSLANVPASQRLFDAATEDSVKLVDLPALAGDAADLAEKLDELGLSLSSRSARRIMDGEIGPLPSLVQRIAEESFPREADSRKDAVAAVPDLVAASRSRTAISPQDMDEFADEVADAFSRLAEKYYLAPATPTITQRGGALQIRIDLIEP